MKPTTLSVFDVFEKERRFMVPLFQRPYVWSQETQWKPLWEDVAAKANEVFQYEADSTYPIRKHFLGAVVMSQVKTFGKQIASMELIDGQQRLTTLQILLCALRDYAKAQGHTDLLTTLDRLTKNTCQVDTVTERYKVWPTTSDREDFEKVYAAGSPDAVAAAYPFRYAKYARKPTPRPRLVDAYLYFAREISGYCESSLAGLTEDAEAESEAQTDEPEQRFDALIRAITRYLEIVTIELEDGDDPQVIFETLNARGEPLLPSDLLRNFVFLEATRRGEKVPLLYATYWSAYDAGSSHDGFWKQEQTQGRLKRPRLDLFIFHYLTAQTKREIPIKHLYQEFRDWWLKNRSVVEDGLKDLQAASVAYRGFLQPIGKSRLDVFCERLKVLDVGTVYPILLLLTATQASKVTTADVPGMISDLESYLVRRYVCGLTTKNYNNIFLSLLKKLGESDPINRATLRTALSGLSGDSARWPSDTEFEKAWLTAPVYRDLGPRRTALVLEALDLQLETSKQEQLHIVSDLTVEHVMPQSWSPAAWPFYDDKTIIAADDDDLLKREQLLHTFGNLTLLTQQLNSSVSNGTFAKKRPEITKQSKLQMNAHFQQFQSADPWNEDTIKARGKTLFQTALQIWPAPDAKP